MKKLDVSSEFVFNFEHKTKAQKFIWNDFPKYDVVFLLGNSGTGKSHLALAMALKELYEKKKKNIYYIRPSVECGSSIGFLPGNIDEKYAPYIDYTNSLISKMVYNLPRDVIEYVPISFIRGRTFENCTAILSEAQNASYSQIKAFLTRMGHNCRIIVEGDSDQSDVYPTQSEFDCDLDAIISRIEDLEGIRIYDLPPGQVIRHPLVAKFTKLL